MKNILVGTMVLVLSGFVVQGAAAQIMMPAQDRQISVTGNAEIRVKPDEVILNLGIETNDLKLDVAKNENDARVKRVLALGKAAGIEDKHIQTEYLNIEPRYRDYEDKRVFLGYWVRRSVALTLRDVTKFDDLLTKVVEGGANYVHGIEFRTTDLRKYRDQAREKAIVAAREKAEALSGALGLKLGKAKMIDEGSGGWWPSYMNTAG